MAACKILQMSDGRPIVFFDLETTGLDTSECDIIQVGAIGMGRVFNSYSVPRRPIDAGASRMNGFTVVHNNLFRHGVPVATVHIIDTLRFFIDFLDSMGGRVLLVAHNARGFDMPVLVRVLELYRLRLQFEGVFGGFLDTLQLSRVLYPDLPNHNLLFLVNYFLGRDFDAHNAVEDTKILQELFEKWQPSEQSIRQCVFPLLM